MCRNKIFYKNLVWRSIFQSGKSVLCVEQQQQQLDHMPLSNPNYRRCYVERSVKKWAASKVTHAKYSTQKVKSIRYERERDKEQNEEK